MSVRGLPRAEQLRAPQGLHPRPDRASQLEVGSSHVKGWAQHNQLTGKGEKHHPANNEHVIKSKKTSPSTIGLYCLWRVKRFDKRACRKGY